jgi:hypothetical protein
MTKLRGTFQLFTAAALLALGANAAQAAQIAGHGDGGATHELRVINNSAGSVEVYVQDAKGHMHRLAKVARSQTGVLEIPEEVTESGAFQIKVLPDAPAWSPWTSGAGMRTHDLKLPEGAAINLWLEPDLRESTVEVPRQ